MGIPTLGVTGANFQAGLSVLINGPQGPASIGAVQIQNVTQSGFTVQAPPLNLPGNYTIQAINPGGAASNAFAFQVR